MEGKSEDDYWNKSSNASFNFDDELDHNDAAIVWDSYSGFDDELGVESATATIPITAIIAQHHLDLILEGVKTSTLRTTTDKFNARDIIVSIMIGVPYNLYRHRSLHHKIALLDAALAIEDGNSITEVVIYLSKTLDNEVFLPLISKRQSAFQHYLVYLCQKNDLKKINELFLSDPNSTNLIEAFYLGCKSNSFHENFRNFMGDFGERLTSDMKSTIIRYNKFISFQVDQKHICNSPIAQLAFLYQNSIENSTFSQNYIAEYVKQLNISELQVEWVTLNTLSLLKLWKKVLDNFVKPNWLTKKSMLKCSIGPEVVLYTLEKHNAPKNILEEFLHFIPDKVQSLEMAKRMKCHKYVIDYYVSQRDRISLIQYKNCIQSQTEDYYYLEQIFKSDKKWKN